MTTANEGKEVKRVEIDLLVAMQIMKHCTQMAPQPVTGLLLGLDVLDTVQITHSFGHLTKETNSGGGYHNYVSPADEAAAAEAGVEYQVEMLKRLRDVNVDSHTVGWYQTTHLGQFFSDVVISTQCQYQADIPNSVLIVYDPLQSAVGKPAFKALRLRKEFVTKYMETQTVNVTETSSKDMFIELPVMVQSPAIVDSFIQNWAFEDPVLTTSQIDTLDVENQAFSEKNVQLLINSLSNLSEEQTKIQMYERQMMKGGDKGGDKGKGKGKGKGKISKPRQVDTMILSQQINTYCKQINSIASDAFGKIYLLANKPASVNTPVATAA